MLQKFADEKRVKMVSGQNPLGVFPSKHSVIFSRYAFVWGWATWRRAWDEYDVKMLDWPSDEVTADLRKWLPSKHSYAYWQAYFAAIRNGLDTWDIQLNYMMFRKKGIAAISSSNLVRNIGFAPGATHTKDPDDDRQFTPVIAVRATLCVPDVARLTNEFDRLIDKKLHFREEVTFLGRIKSRLRKPWHAIKRQLRLG